MNNVASGSYFPNLKELSLMLITFSLTVIAWIFFRATSIKHAFSYISEIFSSSLFSMPNFSRMENGIAIVTLLFFFILVEWLGRERQYAIAKLELNTNKPIRYTFYYTIFFLIIYFKGSQQEFIYFQF